MRWPTANPQQLLRDGWARLGEGAHDAVAWSTWRLPGDERWRGLLVVLAAFGAEERNLTVRIESEEDDDSDGLGGSTTVVRQ